MKKISAIDIILLVLSLVLCFGTAFAFHPCAPKADGSYMMCHWASHVIIALGAVLSLLSLVRLFTQNALVKAGLTLSFVPVAVVCALVPKVLMPLCMMQDMRCHTTMRPAVIVLCVLISALSVVDELVLVKQAAKSAQGGTVR